MESAQDLDAKQLREEAAALAAHLQRIGVRWLPASQPEVVAKLKLEMDFGGEEETLEPQADAAQSARQPSAGQPRSTGQTGSTDQAGSTKQPGSVGQPIPGQPIPGQPIPGQPIPGQPIPGHSTPAASSPAAVSSSTGPSSSSSSASTGPSSPSASSPSASSPSASSPSASSPSASSPSAPSSSTANRPASNRPASRLDPVAAVAVSREPYPGEPLSPEQRQVKLDELALEVSACQRCEKLVSCRKNTVFGEGPAKPRIVFFGEGPGEEEDLSGRPFVGRAGELLTKMIEACTLRREDVYIFNTVKCRPPGNRNPEPEELANCRPYYQAQLQILRPEYIVCLGAVSAQELLQSRLSVGRLRGSTHRYHDSKVLVTYHPAYLLRNPAAKKAAWQDLQRLMKDAGIAIKSR